MGSHYFTDPLEFIINTLFSLYVLVVMLRFLLAWVRADFYNPVSQFLVKATNPLLVPLRKLIPPIGTLDTSSVVLMLLVQMAGISLIMLLRGNGFALLPVLVLSLHELVALAFNVFLFAIIIQVIISWINPHVHNPVTGLLFSLTNPVMTPFRRILPPMSGLDLSPLLAILAIQVAKMLVLPLFGLLLR